jgi:hypothetical protein
MGEPSFPTTATHRHKATSFCITIFINFELSSDMLVLMVKH